jgi:hypothetical protein
VTGILQVTKVQHVKSSQYTRPTRNSQQQAECRSHLQQVDHQFIPIYKCAFLRDSDLFTFLTKFLIWSYSVAVVSQIYLAWIQDKEHHTHFCPISQLSSICPVPYSLPDHSSKCCMQLLVLHMTCRIHFGRKLAASLSANPYSSSNISCTMF